MTTSTIRSVSKILTLAILALGAAAVAACSGGDREPTSQSEDALRCRPGTTCSQQPACDTGTQCCWQGLQSISAFKCGAALYRAGCRGTYFPTRANAVENRGSGHWWFEVYCPPNAYWAAIAEPECANNFEWNTSGDPCTTGTPPAGQVDVLYDPDCPSGCKTQPY